MRRQKDFIAPSWRKSEVDIAMNDTWIHLVIIVALFALFFVNAFLLDPSLEWLREWIKHEQKPLRYALLRRWCGCAACKPKRNSIMDSPQMIKALMPMAPPRKPQHHEVGVRDGDVIRTRDSNVSPNHAGYRLLHTYAQQSIYDTKTGINYFPLGTLGQSFHTVDVSKDEVSVPISPEDFIDKHGGRWVSFPPKASEW